MEEEGFVFETGKLFYNPNMRFSRSFGSLSVGAIGNRESGLRGGRRNVDDRIGEDISVLDGFAASGIRGLRYAKENRNVKSVTLLDIWKIAPAIIEKNAKKNKIKNAEAFNADFNEFAIKNQFDFIEIDPFGTPIQFLNNAFYSFRKSRGGYISLTATDVAVLCGENTKACLKKYGAKNLRNEFTHEIGTRVLLKKIGDFASQFDFGMEPLYSISDRHYIKILLKITRSAEKASEIPRTLGYVSYCFHCGYRETGKFPNRVCGNCKKDMDYAGPLWLGELHERKFLAKMKKLNEKRDYADKKELDKTLDLLIGEAGMPAFYYEMHDLCARLRVERIPRIDEFISELRKKGFRAVRTHFCEKGIKTDAGLKEIEALLQNGEI
ncbi:tRNA (guanine(26)-N(2))-dimethyltransferase [uncultured archaeon]|nr:tRNA (guanine(26)-N(2))-dimethyltransferase [uncultured archaeon]